MNTEKMRKQVARSFSDRMTIEFDPVDGDMNAVHAERNLFLRMMNRKHGQGEIKIWLDDSSYVERIRKFHMEVVK